MNKSFERYVIIYKEKKINLFDLNFDLKTELNGHVDGNNIQTMKNVDESEPVCYWFNDDVDIIYSFNRFEINFKSLFDEAKDKIFRIIAIFEKHNIEITRVAVIKEYVIDDNILNKFKNYYNLSSNMFNDEFNISWLEKFKDNNVEFNFWTYINNNEKKCITYDVNNVYNSDAVLNFPTKVLLLAYQKIEEESQKWSHN